MGKQIWMPLMLLLAVLLTACNNSETYADQKKKERSAINSYIAKEGIKVISESEFSSNGYQTSVERNEYVLFETSGVYMQIIREGCGEQLKDGETATVLCRFDEYNLLADTLQLSNNVLYYSSIVDKMNVKRTLGTFTASFVYGSSVLCSVYGSSTNTSVPSGWLVPLRYIKLGRPSAEGEEIAKVKIIVPHTQGHYYASTNVYPCLYELTYERGI